MTTTSTAATMSTSRTASAMHPSHPDSQGSDYRGTPARYGDDGTVTDAASDSTSRWAVGAQSGGHTGGGLYPSRSSTTGRNALPQPTTRRLDEASTSSSSESEAGSSSRASSPLPPPSPLKRGADGGAGGHSGWQESRERASSPSAHHDGDDDHAGDGRQGHGDTPRRVSSGASASSRAVPGWGGATVASGAGVVADVVADDHVLGRPGTSDSESRSANAASSSSSRALTGGHDHGVPLEGRELGATSTSVDDGLDGPRSHQRSHAGGEQKHHLGL